MLSTMLRSRTARCFGALIGAVALAAALPATASADRDGRGWRSERRHDHGWRDGRGHHAPYRNGHRYAVARHGHGPACSHRPVYRYGYRPYPPYAVYYRSGWRIGR